MHRVSPVIELIKVYMESVLPRDLGEEILASRNGTLVFLVCEPGDAAVGDLAGLFGELERPEGAIAIR